MRKIFQLLAKEPNEIIKVEDFIESYVSYEGQLNIQLKKQKNFWMI